MGRNDLAGSVRAVTSALAAAACVLWPGAGQATEAEPAAWTEHQFEFDYVGYTTRYTCEGLEDKIREVLHDLGARSDMEVHDQRCRRGWFRRDINPTVKIRVATLEPASAPTAGYGTWKKVSLTGGGRLDAADCDLASNIVQRILPIFAVRNVETLLPCGLHTETAMISVHLEAFVPAP